MFRSGFVMVLLQGTLFVILANGLTTSAPLEDKQGLKDGAGPPQYRVNDTKGQPCIIMEMDAHVSFKWEMETNKTKEMDTYVQPKQVVTTGYCRDDAQISVTWKSVQMKWTFAKTRDSAKWFAKEVEVQYNNSFMRTNNSGLSNATTWISRDVLLFSAPLGSAYHCPEDYSLLLNSTKKDSATLLLRRFRIQPFPRDLSFGPSYCPTDSSKITDTPTTIIPVSLSSEASTSDASNISEMVTQSSVSSTEIPNSFPHFSTHDISISDNTDQSHVETTAVPMSSLKTGSPSYQSARLSNDIFTGTTTRPFKSVHSTSASTPSYTSLPVIQNHKALSNPLQVPAYPSKKMFYTGVKMNNNDALSSMLWSWYSSGFYTGYYQALQQQKKTQ